MAVSRPLFIFNSDDLRSSVDANWYIGIKSVPVNTLGVSFGSGNSIPEPGSSNTSVTITSCVIDGVVHNEWDGATLFNAFHFSSVGLIPFLVASGIDGIICSTYTPMSYRAYVYEISSPLPSYLASKLLEKFYSDGDTTRCLPNGRLGCPAYLYNSIANNGSVNYDYSQEAINIRGDRIFDAAVAGALIGETRYNLNKFHLFMDTGDSTFGWTVAHQHSKIAEFVNAGLSNYGYIGSNYGLNTFNTGAANPKPNIFAACTHSWHGSGSQNYDANPVQNSYSVETGGIAIPWYSFQYFWTWDFLRNGGSAAFTSIWEPNSAGVIDPNVAMEYLLTGYSMAEVLGVYRTQACPLWSTTNLPITRTLVQNQTVIGDPLYRPYIGTRLRDMGPAPGA